MESEREFEFDVYGTVDVGMSMEVIFELGLVTD